MLFVIHFLEKELTNSEKFELSYLSDFTIILKFLYLSNLLIFNDSYAILELQFNIF
jgi:hypothetical protein